jgi:hypothetical protein
MDVLVAGVSSRTPRNNRSCGRDTYDCICTRISDNCTCIFCKSRLARASKLMSSCNSIDNALDPASPDQSTPLHFPPHLETFKKLESPRENTNDTLHRRPRFFCFGTFFPCRSFSSPAWILPFSAHIESFSCFCFLLVFLSAHFITQSAYRATTSRLKNSNTFLILTFYFLSLNTRLRRRPT